MGTSVKNFLSHLKFDSKTSERLYERGAYPVWNGEDWLVADDTAKQLYIVLDSYFRRSRALSTARFRGSRDVFIPDWFLTNEASYPNVLRRIQNIGGAYVGVGRSLNFTFPAWQNASHAFAVDQDLSVPFGFVPMWGTLMCMATSPSQFLSLLLGRPLVGPRVGRFSQLSGYALLEAFTKIPFDEGFAETVGKILASVVDKRKEGENAYRVMMEWLDSFRSYMAELYKLYLEDGEGRGGPISGAKAYERERKLFLEGRVTGVGADLSSKKPLLINGALRALGGAGLVYISNVEEWIFDDVDYGGDPESPWNFYRNLGAIRRTADSNPLVITSIGRLDPVVVGLDEYLRRSRPVREITEENSNFIRELYLLRQKVLAEVGNARPVSTRKDAVNNILSSAEGSLWRVLRDVRSHMPDKPLRWEQFQHLMSRKSAAYSGLPAGIRKAVTLNLMDLGVVLPRGERDAAGGSRKFGPGKPVRFLPEMPLSASPDFNAVPFLNMPASAALLGGTMMTGNAMPFALMV